MKTLLLLRHAKAESQHPTADDINRPLAARGREDAQRVGAYLKRESLIPDLVLCSAALRARQTWRLVAEQLSADVEMSQEAGLYLASPPRLLAMIDTAPPSVRRLLIIAHNPGIETLARALCGPNSDVQALAALSHDYPSSGLCLFDLEANDWSQADVAGLRLRRFLSPKSGLPPLAADP